VLTFRPTLDLAKALKLGELDEMPPPTQPLTDWCIRGFKVQRTTYLIFTESLSLYSLLTPRRGITTAAKLRQTFATLVSEEFKHATLGTSPAISILKLLADCRIARGRDRRVLGSINDLVWHAQYYLERGDSISAAIAHVNQALMGHLQMDNPTQRLAQLLKPSKFS